MLRPKSRKDLAASCEGSSQELGRWHLEPAVKTIIEEQGNKDDGSNLDEDSLCNNIIQTVIPALNFM